MMVAVVKSVSKAPTSCLRTDLRNASRMRADCLSLEYIQQEISTVNSLEKRMLLGTRRRTDSWLVRQGVVSTIYLNFSGSTKSVHSVNPAQPPRVYSFSALGARKVNWMLGRRHLSGWTAWSNSVGFIC